MQFPLSPIPLVGGKEDTTEINQPWPAMGVRPISERTSSLVFRNVPPRPPKEERPPEQYAPRAGEERRKGDRRQNNRGAMFDTRSGTDRRQNKRRDTDATTRLNVKA
jgi:hypothetical protein